MRLFRAFSWNRQSLTTGPGGPLHVPRQRQGAGRHDGPDRYGALYCSRDAASAIAETIQFVRGHELSPEDLQLRDGSVRALAAFDLDDTAQVIDLDDPHVLAARDLRPSRVATLDRRVTQRLAHALFDEGVDGLFWWSTLDASWTNVTLFHERVRSRVALASPPAPLTVTMPTLVEAAQRLGIRIAKTAR